MAAAAPCTPPVAVLGWSWLGCCARPAAKRSQSSHPLLVPRCCSRPDSGFGASSSATLAFARQTQQVCIGRRACSWHKQGLITDAHIRLPTRLKILSTSQPTAVVHPGVVLASGPAPVPTREKREPFHSRVAGLLAQRAAQDGARPRPGPRVWTKSSQSLGRARVWCDCSCTALDPVVGRRLTEFPSQRNHP